MVHFAPFCVSRPNPSEVKRQLAEIRSKVVHEEILCHLLGLDRDRLAGPMAQNTMRAVQYLHAILFHQGETVVLVDVLTSFRYAPAPKACKSSPSDLVTGDGDGI